MRLLLFDIDGTILRGNGQGKRSLVEAMRKHVSHPFSTDASMAGRTDTWFLLECLGHLMPETEIRALAPEIYASYGPILKDNFTTDNGVRLCPGVHALLDRLAEEAHRPSCTIGLLTGNCKDGARIKLEAVGLAGRFSFATSAFGDDGCERRELPPIALGRARNIHPHLKGNDVTIIGDTPNDVDCGRPIGASAVAVATGYATADELRSANPEHFFLDLTDTEAVVSSLLR